MKKLLKPLVNLPTVAGLLLLGCVAHLSVVWPASPTYPSGNERLIGWVFLAVCVLAGLTVIVLGCRDKLAWQRRFER